MKKGDKENDDYNFILIFLAGSDIEFCVLDFPDFLSHFLKALFSNLHSASDLIVTDVIHLFDLHLFQKFLSLIEFKRVAYILIKMS